MKVIDRPIDGLIVLEPVIHRDDRGYFFESYNKLTFERATGVQIDFMQDNQALSVKNVLRGLHFQNNPVPQAKLLRVIEGSIWDVAVDIRKNSPTYLQYFGIELSAENKLQFFIPHGFAHGYTVLSDTAIVAYKCDNLYSKEHEGGMLYNDPAISIDWKIDMGKAIVSEKDKKQPLAAESNNLF